MRTTKGCKMVAAILAGAEVVVVSRHTTYDSAIFFAKGSNIYGWCRALGTVGPKRESELAEHFDRLASEGARLFVRGLEDGKGATK